MSRRGHRESPAAVDDTTRRAFLQRAAALGLAVPSLSAALAACGGSGGGGGGGGSSSFADVASVGDVVTTPAPTGELDLLNWAITAEPTSVDWTLAYNDVYNTVVANVTESVVQLTPQFEFVPGLAEAWSTEDPRAIVLTLRSGVKFHDGSEMTAEDVAFSLSRNLTAASYWSGWTTTVESVEVTGPLEVTISLSQPDSLLLNMLATPVGGVGKAADVRAKGRAFGTAEGLPLGTGPFRFDRWLPGREFQLSRFDEYWDTEHVAKAERLVIRVVSDPNALVNALVSGEIDGMYQPPFDQLDRLRGSGSGTLYLGKSLRESLAIVSEKEGPLRDPKVRLAWLTAIDRVALAERIYQRAAAPFRNTFVPFDSWIGSDEVREMARTAYFELGGPEPDLAKARQLLEEVGVPTEEIVLWVRSGPGQRETGEIMQAAGKQLGLDVKLVVVPEIELLGLFYDAEARKKVDIFVSGQYWSSIPDPLQIMWELLYPPQEGVASYNFTIDDPQITRLLDEARATTDDEVKRAQALIDAQARAEELVPVLPMVAPANPLYMNDRVTGAPAAFVELFYPWARDVGAA